MTRPKSYHECPLCRTGDVPARTVTCRPCWYAMPPKIRANLAVASVFRETSPLAYDEALAAALQWRQDQRTADYAAANAAKVGDDA